MLQQQASPARLTLAVAVLLVGALAWSYVRPSSLTVPPLTVRAPLADGATVDLSARRATLFVHVFKAMGTTVEALLKRWCAAHGRRYLAYTRWMDTEHALGHANLSSTADMSLQLSDAQAAHVRAHDVIAGHLLFGMLGALDRPVVVITVLREPRELYVSGTLFKLRRLAARASLPGFAAADEAECELLRFSPLPSAEGRAGGAGCVPGQPRAASQGTPTQAASAPRAEAAASEGVALSRAIAERMRAVNLSLGIASAAVARRVEMEVEELGAEGTPLACGVRGPRLSTWLTPAPQLRGASSAELLPHALAALRRIGVVGLAERPATTVRMIAYALEATQGTRPSAEVLERDGGRAAERWSWAREGRFRRNAMPAPFSARDVLSVLPSAARAQLDALLQCEATLYTAARRRHAQQACAMLGVQCGAPRMAEASAIAPAAAADDAGPPEEHTGSKRVAFSGAVYSVPHARFFALEGAPATILRAEGGAPVVVRWVAETRTWEVLERPSVDDARRLLLRHALERLRVLVPPAAASPSSAG